MLRRRILAFLVLAASVPLAGQSGPPTGKSRAPSEADFTGNWVSIVNSDWRWRMLPPPKGDYASIPINAEGKRVADLWDPAKDEAAGEQCRSYGAPAIMEVPGRLRIGWQDDNTLKVEIDAGQQTRLFHFGNWKAPAGPATWQGDSLAAWEASGPNANALLGPGPRAKYGSLQITTTHIRPGYLRKNGVPYSANAEMAEHWSLVRQPDGSQWLVVTTVLHDPPYLLEDMVTALHFRKEADGAKWDPQPCSARW